jgi:hypothetical protein
MADESGGDGGERELDVLELTVGSIYLRWSSLLVEAERAPSRADGGGVRRGMAGMTREAQDFFYFIFMDHNGEEL